MCDATSQHEESIEMQIDPARLSHIVGSGIQKATGAPATPEASPAQGAPSPQAAAAPEGADRLVLSQQATEVRAAYEALAALPDARPELVAKLKAEIEAGTYQVNPDAIAEKMIP